MIYCCNLQEITVKCVAVFKVFFINWMQRRRKRAIDKCTHSYLPNGYSDFNSLQEPFVE